MTPHPGRGEQSARLLRRDGRTIPLIRGAPAGEPNQLARKREQPDHDERANQGVRTSALEGDERSGSPGPAHTEEDVLL